MHLDADFSMLVFNADGTEASMCGNAGRCVGKYVYENGLTDKTVLRLETRSGIRELRLNVDKANNTVESVTMGMERPAFGCVGEPLRISSAGGLLLSGTEVCMGNIHLVVFVDEVSAVQLEVVGPELEHFPGLRYARRNVEFAQILNQSSVRMRVWEQGSGVTKACGTGACAAVVAAVWHNLTDRKVTVVMDGGSLDIEWRSDSDQVFMTGNAVTVFEGTIGLPSGDKL